MRQLEAVLYISEHEPELPKAWRDAVHNWDFDDALVCSLGLEQRLSLAETYGDEFDPVRTRLSIGEVSLNLIRIS